MIRSAVALTHPSWMRNHGTAKEDAMAKLRVHNFAISLDGYGAGPNQSLDTPLGVGGEELHQWMFETRTWRQRTGEEGGDEGINDEFMVAGDAGIGATIMGRNMFGPIRDEWPDEAWRGWWGDEPPYHHQVFVLTHHARPSFEMEGGNVFHFVTDGIESALAQATAAAGGQDVRLGGGVATIREYLRAGLLDELHLVIVPILLGSGERILGGGVTDGYEVTQFVASKEATHVRLSRSRL
jgi:dihydrofolate reductase